MAVFYKISLEGGESTDLTLNLGALSELSKRDKPVVDRYFYFYKRLQKKDADFNELEMGEILYIAYRAAHCKQDSTECMDLQEFLNVLTDDREELGRVFSQLFGVAQEKKQASPMPSNGRHQKRRGK